MIESTKKIVLDFNIDEVWNTITDNTNFNWRTDLSNIEVIDKNNFIEYTKKDFPTHFNITNKIKNVIYEFDINNKNIKGHWIGNFKKIDKSKTELELIEQIECNNFIKKILIKMYLKNQQDLYVENLIKKLSNRK